MCGNDPGGYWWPPTKSTWTPTIVSFSFSVSLIIADFTIFTSFLGPELPEPFCGPERRFFGKTRSNMGPQIVVSLPKVVVLG